MAKLGTTTRPAIVRYRDMERAAAVTAFCDTHHWIVIAAGVEPEQPEDISDVKKLINRHLPLRAALEARKKLTQELGL